MRSADEATISHEPISSENLMERAATACYQWLQTYFASAQTYAIVCGVGNNGGDGLVLARLLKENGLQVSLFVVGSTDKASADFTTNLHKLNGISPVYITNAEDLNGSYNVAIDCLFGTGLNKPITGLAADAIAAFNALQAVKVAIDLPSGLFADDNSQNTGAIVKADITLTFEAPKLSFFFVENAQFVGEFHILPIGLDADYIAQIPAQNHLITGNELKQLVPARHRFSHKGTFGHALLVGGSKGMVGAMVLGASAAIRSGAGLTTVYVPHCGYTVLQTAVPEAMCITGGDDYLDTMPKTEAYTGIGVGPGLGLGNGQEQLVKQLLNYATAPLVMDADALNILAENPTWLHFLPANTILTPHPGEFDRLANMPKGSTGYDRYLKQRELAAKWNCIIVLKGAYSSISFPDGTVFFNSTGNPGMATGGSGDVLTGIITGLLAQRFKPRMAAIIGVYLHGLAGDLAAADLSEPSLTAGDIVNYIGQAYKKLLA